MKNKLKNWRVGTQRMHHPISNHSGGGLRHLQPTSPGLLLGLAILISASLMVILTPSARGEEAGYTFRAVAYINSPAPGGGAFVSDFEPTRLNNRGQIAFTAEPDMPGEEAIFLAGDKTIKQIMRFGQAAPGGGSFSTFELGNIGLNDSGDLAFAFTLEPLQFAPFIYGGVYRYSHITQTLSPVVIPGVTPAPGGGMFLGAGFNVSLNNRGALAFGAFVDTPVGPKGGVFVADTRGFITTVATYGTAAPGGGTFDSAGQPWMNDRSDVAFIANRGVNPATAAIYVQRAATGQIEAIPSPPGFLGAFFPVINNRGDVAFGLNASPFRPDGGCETVGLGAVYLRTRNSTVRVAGVGDPAPGGGHISNIPIACLSGQLGLNNLGTVAFEVATDTGDEALLLYSHGSFRVVAHVGTVIPGVGTIHSLEQIGVLITPPPTVGSSFPISFAALNDGGQVAFVATLEDGRGVLLLATPRDDD